MTVPASPAAATVPSADALMQLMQGYQATAILRTGVELGVFDRLADGPATAAEVAASAGADERGTRILLDALAGLGLLDAVDGGGYRLSPLSATYLVSGGPAYLGSLTRVFAADHLWDRFRALGEAVRRGGAVTEDHAETPMHPWWEEFAASIGGLAAAAAPAVAATIAPWAGGRDRLEVLDVACGNGMYGYTIALQQPQAHVWSLDWPNVLGATRRMADRLGVADRADYIEGDMFEVDLGGPHDLVVMSHVLHHFDEGRCVDLLRRAAAVTRDDGRIVIQDFVATGDDRGRDVAAGMFSVIMLVWSRQGEAHPLARLERMLAAAGFGRPEVHPLPHLPTTVLVASRRSR
jgi:2-polyprenyl-3-methyl-5-hydroxy-6-metoxy-1,4-benzoquinol methylase